MITLGKTRLGKVKFYSQLNSQFHMWFIYVYAFAIFLNLAFPFFFWNNSTLLRLQPISQHSFTWPTFNHSSILKYHLSAIIFSSLISQNSPIRTASSIFYFILSLEVKKQEIKKIERQSVLGFEDGNILL